MKHSIPLAGLALAVAAVTVAAVSKPAKHLTPERVAEVNALSDAANPGRVTIEVSGLPKMKITPDGSKAVMEMVRELRYPTAWEPPGVPKTPLPAKAAVAAESAGAFPVAPTTPRQFETLNAGWTITFTTKARGGLIDLYGVADFVEAELVKGGYGALSGPIMTDEGVMITPNKVDLPKSHTTTTRFHLFAVSGETYDITLYRGSKEEKHTVTVTAE